MQIVQPCETLDDSLSRTRPLAIRWRPIFDILPGVGFSPVVCCRRTRPSQAGKSRPRRKLSIGGASAWSASAVVGPMPGIVISRAVCSRSLALFRIFRIFRIFRSGPSIFSSSSSIRPSSSHPSSTTASGRPQSPASRTPARCLIRDLPCGATTPYSAGDPEVARRAVDWFDAVWDQASEYKR